MELGFHLDGYLQENLQHKHIVLEATACLILIVQYRKQKFKSLKKMALFSYSVNCEGFYNLRVVSCEYY